MVKGILQCFLFDKTSKNWLTKISSFWDALCLMYAGPDICASKHEMHLIVYRVKICAPVEWS